MSTTLTSERLILRPWREDDLDALAQLCADPEVMAHFPAVLDRAGSVELLGKLMAHQAEHGFTFWCLERREDGAWPGRAGGRAMRWRRHGVRCSSPSRICSWMK